MNTITLISKDLKKLVVEIKKANIFITLKNIIEDLEVDEKTEIPVDVDYDILVFIFSCLTKKEEEEGFDITLPEKMEDSLIFSSMISVNYFDNEVFLDALATKVADIIKSYDDVQALRERFGIKNDFEGEELEQIKREEAALKDM